MGQESLPPDIAERNMWKWKWRRRALVAQGGYPVQTVIRNGTVLNVFTDELIPADIAIDGGMIVGIGAYPEAHEEIDVQGAVVAPAFIDAHIHTESSLLWLPEFARAVIPHGTGAIVTDPHEMANVAGLPGVQAMRDAARELPLTVRFTAPSCVPASKHEHPGAVFGLDAIHDMLEWPETVGLGELMSFADLLAADSHIGDLLAATRGSLRDGHAPSVNGPHLQAYAGSGIHADHESTGASEAKEKLRAGMMVMIREGSSEKNLTDLLPIIDDHTYPRICFASDDRDADDLLRHGHVDDILRQAIAGGIDPIRAIRMATWNPASFWRIEGHGAIAPGYQANLVVLSDLENVAVSATIHRGKIVAQDGAIVEVESSGEHEIPSFLTSSVSIAPLRRSQLAIPAARVPGAIELISDQIVTRLIEWTPRTNGDLAIADPDNDVLKVVCVDRHHATGRVGVGFVKGFGLRRGAMASTLAHDAHNIVAVGATDEDILAAIAVIGESQGGLAVVADGEVLAHLPLPIAGLMSDQPLTTVAEGYERLGAAARHLGATPRDPFGQLAFLALSVIPEARITLDGLLHVGASAPVAKG